MGAEEADSGEFRYEMQSNKERMMKICKRYTFEAAHSLPLHKGKCANLHGHSYTLEVEVEGRIKMMRGESDDGMVMDFDDLDQRVEPIVKALDHNGSLNDNPYLAIPRTTAEMICENIARLLQPSIDIAGMDYPGQYERRLSRVRLYETAKAYAEWTPS
jgi:6-pyruvoyltetrahydropterin/6-carboxytetrahydropterin synthase